MATTTNVGDQVRHLKFGEDLTAKLVNKRFVDLVPFGIYDGFDPTIVSTTDLDVSPGVAHIGDNQSNTLRVETQSTVTTNPTPSSPYVVLLWDFQAQKDNYMDIKAVGSVTNQMLKICKATFSGKNLDGVDLRERDVPTYTNDLEIEGDLRVQRAYDVDPSIVNSTPYTVGSDDYVLNVKTSTIGEEVTINLPKGVDLEHGRRLEIFDGESGADINNIVLQPGNNDDINSQSSFTLDSGHAYVKLTYFNSINRWGIHSVGNE